MDDVIWKWWYVLRDMEVAFWFGVGVAAVSFVMTYWLFKGKYQRIVKWGLPVCWAGMLWVIYELG